MGLGMMIHSKQHTTEIDAYHKIFIEHLVSLSMMGILQLWSNEKHTAKFSVSRNAAILGGVSTGLAGEQKPFSFLFCVKHLLYFPSVSRQRLNDCTHHIIVFG